MFVPWGVIFSASHFVIAVSVLFDLSAEHIFRFLFDPANRLTNGPIDKIPDNWDRVPVIIPDYPWMIKVTVLGMIDRDTISCFNSAKIN